VETLATLTASIIKAVDDPADVSIGFDSSGNILQGYDSLIKFHKAFTSVNGSGVQAFCVRGANVYYWGSPSSIDTFTLHGFRLPTLLVDETDEPDCLPVHLRHRLLVNYACMELYGEIEQDHRQVSYNFQKYQTMYAQALTDLFSAVEKDVESVYIEDERF